jgi:hypothetical protein
VAVDIMLSFDHTLEGRDHRAFWGGEPLRF